MTKGFIAVLAFVVVTMVGSPAYAHAPGPTNYRSVVVSISPDHGWIAAKIIGGDSFLDLRVQRGHDVVVTGYKGERYLRFLADGTVEENVASLTHYSNRSRYGSAIPADVDPPAAEVWRTVANDGHWTWHDHRTHWMNSFSPPGRHPGDVILEGVVPIVVDGQPVSLSVRSTWLASPSLFVPVLIAVLAIGAMATAFRLARSLVPIVLTVAAAAGLFVGLGQYWSVPSSLNPDRLAWLLPGASIVSLGVALVLGRRISKPAVSAIAAFAAIELLTWAYLRRATLTRAVLPTELPFWLDRSVSAMCIGVSTAALAVSLRRILTDSMPPSPTTSPAPQR